jgi:hypothetical protein
VFDVAVLVTDSAGQTATGQFEITVMPALSLTVTGIPGAVVGQAFTFQLAPTGGTPPYTFSGG